MQEKRFSTVVARYFSTKGTYPVTLMFKNQQVDDQFLVSLDDAVYERFGDRDDIEIVTTRIVEGDFWSGVLVEFNQDEFDGVDSTDFEWGVDTGDRTLVQHLQTLYDEFAELDTSVVGLSCGSSVYSVASLESLGESYFKTASDVYNGPSL